MSKQTLEMITAKDYDSFYESFSDFIDRKAREEVFGEKKKQYEDEDGDVDDEDETDDEKKERKNKKNEMERDAVDDGKTGDNADDDARDED